VKICRGQKRKNQRQRYPGIYGFFPTGGVIAKRFKIALAGKKVNNLYIPYIKKFYSVTLSIYMEQREYASGGERHVGDDHKGDKQYNKKRDDRAGDGKQRFVKTKRREEQIEPQWRGKIAEFEVGKEYHAQVDRIYPIGPSERYNERRNNDYCAINIHEAGSDDQQ
jgi:hypothetical protein